MALSKLSRFYYDPSTGEFRTTKPVLKQQCWHGLRGGDKGLYVSPCDNCGKACNCDLKNDYPDVIVRSLDDKSVRLSSCLVRGSRILQQMVWDHRKGLRDTSNTSTTTIDLSDSDDNTEDIVIGDDDDEPVPEKKLGVCDNKKPLITIEDDGEGDQVITITIDDDEKHEIIIQDGENEKKPQPVITTENDGVDVITINDSDFEDESESESGTGVLDLVEFPNDVIDLRKGNEVTLGVATKVLMMLQQFMALHLEQIDAELEAEKRAQAFFLISMFPRPPRPTKNNCKFEEWEEEFFDVDFCTFLSLHQAKQQLVMFDMNYAMEKWFYLFQGRPCIDGFGECYYLDDPTDETDDAGCENFRNGAPKINRGRTTHLRPQIRLYRKWLWRMY